MLNEILERNARRYPNKTALVFQKKRLTFADLNDRVNRLTNGLSELGVSKGDRVTIGDRKNHAELFLQCNLLRLHGHEMISWASSSDKTHSS